MPLVNYEGGSSDEEDNNNDQIETTTTATRRLHLPAPSHPPSNKIIDIDDDDEDNANENSIKSNIQTSSSLLANLPKPQDASSSLNIELNPTELPEDELEDIVRGDNKEYAKNIPQAPKSIKRKRDGPVKIFIPTIEQVSFLFIFYPITLFLIYRILMMKINLNENNQQLNA